jgi:hypothetical protein
VQSPEFKPQYHQNNSSNSKTNSKTNNNNKKNKKTFPFSSKTMALGHFFPFFPKPFAFSSMTCSNKIPLF